MKHLHYYEHIKNETEPEPDDYVICKDTYYLKKDIHDFLENNIGQIISIDSCDFYIKYENIPLNLISYFDFDDINKNNDVGVALMYNNEILYYSKDKEYLKQLLINKKFNI